MVQNETTSLATIQQLDPIYADFTQSVLGDEPPAPCVRQRRSRPDCARRRQVHLVLDDATVYPVAGRLLFSEVKVDAIPGR